MDSFNLKRASNGFFTVKGKDPLSRFDTFVKAMELEDLKDRLRERIKNSRVSRSKYKRRPKNRHRH